MSVKSSDNIFDVLDHLTRCSSPVSGAEIAAALQIPITSMARALSTLEAAGYARRTVGQPRYELGHAGQMLAYAYMSQFPIRNAALPYLQQLTSISGYSCALFQLVGRYAVRIAFIAGSGAIINLSPLGEARSFEDGAAGCLFKAYELALSEHRGAEDDVAHRSEEIRRQGFVRSPSSHEQGGDDVAFPLFATGATNPSAAVVLEGVTGNESLDALDTWKSMISPLQAAILRDSRLMASPYAHLSRSAIDMGLGLVAQDLGTIETDLG